MAMLMKAVEDLHVVEGFALEESGGDNGGHSDVQAQAQQLQRLLYLKALELKQMQRGDDSDSVSDSDSGSSSNESENDDHYDDDHPKNFICPITQAVMVDPVVTADGHTYEREAIEQWFETAHTRYCGEWMNEWEYLNAWMNLTPYPFLSVYFVHIVYDVISARWPTNT